MDVRHLRDEDLLLDYYGEADARPDIREHLAACAECRALDRELRGVLALVDSEPLPDAPVGFEQQMWARLEPHIRTNVGAAEVGAAFRRPTAVQLPPSPGFGGLRKPDTTSWRRTTSSRC